MDKKSVAGILKKIGTMLDLKGENPFKTRAYHNGARIIETLDRDIEELVASGELADLKGIGKALSEKISTLVATGSLPYYDNLLAETPPGLLEMLEIPGMGAKKVKAVHDELGIASLGELEYACRENRLRDLSGFGEKSQQKILQGIELRKKYSERFLFPVAENEATALLAYLKKDERILRIEIAGSLRRKKETIRDIDIVASCRSSDRESLMQYFVNYPEAETITGQGNTKSAIVLNSGIGCDLRLVDDAEYPFLLHHSTGSKEHNTAMRSRAKSLGLKMNEYGIFRDDKRIECADEAAVFAALGLDYIPPELRDDMGELDAAEQHTLPRLYDGAKMYGLFHVHTTWSDGAHSLEQMAQACRDMGLQYLGICDHSKSAFYANGLNEERVLRQHAEIDTLNGRWTDFKIFKGIESDILPDGSLDYDDGFLQHFDFVVASVHSSFNLSREAQTRRLVRAVRHPSTTMLGHPTGRLLLGREPYDVDMEAVVKAAGAAGKIIEINSSPYRLDLDWRLGKLAKSVGVKVALNPDAHSIDGLKDFRYGIGIARKGWFETGDVINAMTVEQVGQLFTLFSGDI